MFVDDAYVTTFSADGVISAIETVAPPPELDLPPIPVTRISIFMNVFDVHVNRAPVDGRIARMAYVAGKFFNASLDKASADNERQALTLEISHIVSLTQNSNELRAQWSAAIP